MYEKEFNKHHACDMIIKVLFASGKSTQGVRLNSIKRLARTVKNGFKEDLNKQHQCEIDGNKLH